VNVLFTIGLILAAAGWAFAVGRRLAQLRGQVKLAWKRLEPDQSNEAVRTVYNKHVATYNDALGSFPAYVIAPLAGFKPARRF
jgi:hypothetical protein